MPEPPEADRPYTDRPPVDALRPQPQQADRQQLEALEEELRAARQKRDTYQGLLKELPEVFEGKFRERLRPVQQRNEQLLEEGLALRDQIRRALPQAGSAGSLPAAPSEAPRPIPESVSDDNPQPLPPDSPGQPTLLSRLEALLQPLQHRPAVGLALCAAALGLGLGSAALLSSRERSAPPSSPGRVAPEANPAAAPNLPVAPNPVPAASPAASGTGPALLTVRALGPSWIEVRGPAGELLYSDELTGTRSFPLARGLQLRSGRSDLVRIQINGGPERALGAVEDLSWKRFPPAAPPAPSSAEP